MCKTKLYDVVAVPKMKCLGQGDSWVQNHILGMSSLHAISPPQLGIITRAKKGRLVDLFFFKRGVPMSRCKIIHRALKEQA
jgi:hypothetical protein